MCPLDPPLLLIQVSPGWQLLRAPSRGNLQCRPEVGWMEASPSSPLGDTEPVLKVKRP